MKNELTVAMQAEADARKLQEKLITSISDAVSKAIMPGVKVEGSNPSHGIVSFSTVSAVGSLSPRTYLPDAKANAVKRKLSSCTTVTKTVERIEEMLSTRKVYFGRGDTVMLNPATLKVLEDFLQDTITDP